MDKDKFEIGDVIIGTEKANNCYRITRKGWIGVIKEISVGGIVHAEGKDEWGNLNSFPVDIRCFDVLGNLTAIKLARQLGFEGKKESEVRYDYN